MAPPGYMLTLRLSKDIKCCLLHCTQYPFQDIDMLQLPTTEKIILLLTNNKAFDWVSSIAIIFTNPNLISQTQHAALYSQQKSSFQVELPTFISRLVTPMSINTTACWIQCSLIEDLMLSNVLLQEYASTISGIEGTIEGKLANTVFAFSQNSSIRTCLDHKIIEIHWSFLSLVHPVTPPDRHGYVINDSIQNDNIFYHITKSNIMLLRVWIFKKQRKRCFGRYQKRIVSSNHVINGW